MISKQQQLPSSVALGKQRNYNEIVAYLDSHWANPTAHRTLEVMQALHAALGSPAQKLHTILVGGTNGKSLTVHFATRLLKQEGVQVGTFLAPHLMTYNERILCNSELISNKAFTEVANEVINTAEHLNLDASSSEILTCMALRHFVDNEVDVAVLEVANGGSNDPTNVCTTNVAVVTRVTTDDTREWHTSLQDTIEEAVGIVKQGTWLVSADQTKAHLVTMQKACQERGGNWAMPIRKVAALAYPFEQLHGRCAALAERAAQLYVQEWVVPQSTVVTHSLLTKPKGQRGRPTLEAKRQSELNPQQTLEQFWKETISTLPGRFQLLNKEKPSILIDTASNIDALENLLLGVRLLHYQRPLKGLAIILGAHHGSLESQECIKQLRYFFKKTSGCVILCPVSDEVKTQWSPGSWNVESMTNHLKNAKVKAKAAKDFTHALELAKKTVDEHHGLVVVAGSSDIVAQYWYHKGVKKL